MTEGSNDFGESLDTLGDLQVRELIGAGWHDVWHVTTLETVSS